MAIYRKYEFKRADKIEISDIGTHRVFGAFETLAELKAGLGDYKFGPCVLRVIYGKGDRVADRLCRTRHQVEFMLDRLR